MALYFEYQINKNALLQTAFFGDFAYWDRGRQIYWKKKKQQYFSHGMSFTTRRRNDLQLMFTNT